MCLSSTYSREQKEELLPKKPFYAYKFVTLERTRAPQLVSPHYHYVWRPGVATTDSSEGFYLFMCPPGKLLAASQNQQILRVLIRPEDVQKMGPDKSHGFEGTCVVVRKLEVAIEDFNSCLAGKSNQLTSEEFAILDKARKTVQKLVKKKEEVKEAQVEEVKVAAKSARKKASKQSATKAAQIKKAKKAVKKAVKQAAKTVKKSVKKKTATVKAVKTAVKKTNPKIAKAAKAVKAKAKAKSTRSSTTQLKATYENLTVAELRDLCKTYKISGYSSMSKPKLIHALLSYKPPR